MTGDKRELVNMTRIVLRSVISLCTALSLALALVVSVFAQSHAAPPSPVSLEQPCAEHQAPLSTSNWADTCASLCDAADFHMVLSGTGERPQDSDLTVLPVSYSAPQLPALVQSCITGDWQGHDPPGSRLYLTTHRLRI